MNTFSHTSQARNLSNFKNIDNDCQIFHDERVLSKECDFFIPAGNELSINSRTAKSLNCKVMVEAANGPVSFEAEQVLLERGITIFPDVLVNSGSLVVNYYEYLKNLKKRDQGKIMNKWEERANTRFLSLVTELSGITFEESRLNAEQKELLKGAKEGDLVMSTMQGGI